MSTSEQLEESPEITPQVLHITDLLKWVRKGRVRVPNFQRDFVWNRPRMLDLFDSIRKQYPIGTLLFWRPSTRYPLRNRIGPLRTPDGDENPLIVLDGQQRLTTLAGVLLFEAMDTEENDSDPGRWQVYFDASGAGGGDFVHLKEPPSPSCVLVRDMMDTLSMYDLVSKMMESVPDGEDITPQAKAEARKERSEWVRRVQRAASAITSYRIPIVEFATDNLQLAIDSFKRLNHSGMIIGPDEMFTALTYLAEGEHESFALATHIDELVHEVQRRGFGEIDRVMVLRAVLAAADMDPYRTEWDRLGETLKTSAREKLPDAIESAREGLILAIDFLRGENVFNERMLPYRMQLVALGAFFARCRAPTDAQRAVLRRWLWVSSFTAWFGSGNPAKVRRLIEVLKDEVAADRNATSIKDFDLDAPAEPFPKRYDLRSARVRALVCALLHDGALGPDGTALSPKEVSRQVLERGPEAFARIFNRTTGDPSERWMFASPANRILDVAPDVRGQAKNWLVELDSAHASDIFASHHMPESADGLLRTDDRTTLLTLRLQTLKRLERRFMEERGVTPPIVDEPTLSALDVEDDAPLADDLVDDREP
ncbi:MAG: DUF262 domain-containing protein [Alphaproteobacteria bacterium]|nr:DUF262 domain-containing protein [Alphaproteobacteria bacterium]